MKFLFSASRFSVPPPPLLYFFCFFKFFLFSCDFRRVKNVNGIFILIFKVFCLIPLPHAAPFACFCCVLYIHSDTHVFHTTNPHTHTHAARSTVVSMLRISIVSPRVASCRVLAPSSSSSPSPRRAFVCCFCKLLLA